MGVEIIFLGGVGEVGRNAVILDNGKEAVMIDLGLHMDKYIALSQDENIEHISTKQLLAHDAVPRVDKLPRDLIDRIKAIIPSHAHLDHIGAIPFLASKFKNASIYATPFTKGLIDSLINDKDVAIFNDIYEVPLNKEFSISKNISVELINITHSTPDSSVVSINFNGKSIVYANDYKLDNAPVIGQKSKISHIKKLAPVDILISESLYAHMPGKTPSERIARELLRDVMLGINKEGRAIIATTFSSHIARLKTLVELGKRINRNIIILGRSMGRYLGVAKEKKIYELPKKVKLKIFRREINKFLRNVKHPEEFLFIVTGNQGEPKAVLPRMVENLFSFNKNDIVMFSCSIIPTPQNIKNRERLEKKLMEKGVRIFTDLHVSGHAFREDLREMLFYTEPKNVVPMHSEIGNMLSYKELVEETMETKVFLPKTFERVKI